MGSEIGVDIFRRRDSAVHVAVGAEMTVRVAAGVDFAQGFNVDVGVDLGGLDALVPQHFLHITDVGSAAMHVGGAGMSPGVSRNPHNLLLTCRVIWEADITTRDARSMASLQEGF